MHADDAFALAGLIGLLLVVVVAISVRNAQIKWTKLQRPPEPDYATAIEELQWWQTGEDPPEYKADNTD